MSVVKKALEDCRYPVIKGKRCRILEYQLKMSKPSTKELYIEALNCYLFVKGFISLSWDHKDLYDNFK